MVNGNVSAGIERNLWNQANILWDTTSARRAPRMLRQVMMTAAVALASVIGVSGASAQTTGDFKVTAVGYTSDVATVGGTVNRGAIQSGKSVVVAITYEYSFVAERIETTEGAITTLQVFLPGRCTLAGATERAECYDQNGLPKALNGANWTGQYQTQTVTTEPQTLTYTFDGTSGMTALTEPTIEKGRLNPKGKITGYNWVSGQSIVPNADLVDPALVPWGYDVVSVVIISVSYTTYLVDAGGFPVADTVTSGSLLQ